MDARLHGAKKPHFQVEGSQVLGWISLGSPCSVCLHPYTTAQQDVDEKKAGAEHQML